MGGLFGSRPQTVVQQAPEPKPPAPMPDSDSPAIMEARRRRQIEIMTRAGRSSTILTAPERRGDYSSNTLGAGA